MSTGNVGIGHVRYPTAGTASASEAQPFFVNSPLGIYLIHNGNLTNTDVLRGKLNSSQSFFNRHLRTDSDSEVIPIASCLISSIVCSGFWVGAARMARCRPSCSGFSWGRYDNAETTQPYDSTEQCKGVCGHPSLMFSYAERDVLFKTLHFPTTLYCLTPPDTLQSLRT